MNIDELPWVRLDRTGYLPNISAVYFAVSRNKVLYVGQSKNLKERWQYHHKNDELLKYTNVRIYWIEVGINYLYEEEGKYIGMFMPPLNDVVRQKTFLSRFGKHPYSMFKFTLLYLTITGTYIVYILIKFHGNPEISSYLVNVNLVAFALYGLHLVCMAIWKMRAWKYDKELK